MEEDFDYYLIERDARGAYPLLATDSHFPHTMMYIRTLTAIDEPLVTGFVFSEPVPKNPIIGDYFSQTESVVSSRIKNVLETLNIYGIQLIPAIVTDQNGHTYRDYFYIHIFNHIEAMDKINSNFEQDEDDEDYYDIDSFVLDKDILREVALENRLIFKLKEDSTIKIYHKSIVDAIMATNPTGVHFTKVENWRY